MKQITNKIIDCLKKVDRLKKELLLLKEKVESKPIEKRRKKR
jgi:hypothetical protein